MDSISKFEKQNKDSFKKLRKFLFFACTAYVVFWLNGI